MTSQKSTTLHLAEIERQYAQTTIRDLVERAWEAGMRREGLAPTKPTSSEVENAIIALEASGVAVCIAKGLIDNTLAELQERVARWEGTAKRAGFEGLTEAMNFLLSEAEKRDPTPIDIKVPAYTQVDFGTFPPQPENFVPKPGALKAVVDGRTYMGNPKDALYSLMTMLATEYWNGNSWEKVTSEPYVVNAVEKESDGPVREPYVLVDDQPSPSIVYDRATWISAGEADYRNVHDQKGTGRKWIREASLKGGATTGKS